MSPSSEIARKFNLACHFDKYHPSWQTCLPHLPDFITEILMTTDEHKGKKGNPGDRVFHWPQS